MSEDAVARAERLQEAVLERKPSGLQKPLETGGKTEVKRVPNVTCPACLQVLPEAVAINGRIRGWCGVKSVFVNVPIPQPKQEVPNAV